jgi:transposase
MRRPVVPGELWAAIKPLLRSEPTKLEGGRPRSDERAVLAGIVSVPRSGIGWEMLPRELGCSGMTCWGRLHDWQEAGV